MKRVKLLLEHNEDHSTPMAPSVAEWLASMDNKPPSEYTNDEKMELKMVLAMEHYARELVRFGDKT